jgi:hypothetical protein
MHGGAEVTDLDRTLLSLIRGERATSPDRNVAQTQQAVMSLHQAWKAFRMGIIAAQPNFPESKEALGEYWRVMRNRFNDWYAAYLKGRIDKLASVGDRVVPSFNPPRAKRKEGSR